MGLVYSETLLVGGSHYGSFGGLFDHLSPTSESHETTGTSLQLSELFIHSMFWERWHVPPLEDIEVTLHRYTRIVNSFQ